MKTSEQGNENGMKQFYIHVWKSMHNERLAPHRWYVYSIYIYNDIVIV